VFAAAGIKVALVEAEQIGHASSGSSIGWIADDPGLPFLDVEKALGRRAARHVFQAWHRAALDFGALLRRLTVRCSLEPRGSMLLATTPEQTATLHRERKSRRDAGIDAPLLNPRAIAGELGLTASGATRSRDGFTLDPYRATLGLAGEATKRGALLFERTAAKRTKFGRRSAEVHTKGGTIRASRVVIATGMPTPLFGTLVRHFWFKSAFLTMTAPIPAKIRNQLGAPTEVVRDMAVPCHVLRWHDGQLIVSGADGDTPPNRLREKVLVQRTGQLMYELSTVYPDISGIAPAYGWDAQYARTADGLPYIGPHRNYPHHLFAFGDASPSVTGAYLASRVLLRQFLDESRREDEALGFNRYGHVR
jgi:glycine/D-amino acid oxidase-like deaminating enzyme